MKIYRNNARKGVTLVEIAVVLMVIALLFTIVASMLSNIALLQSADDEAVLIKKVLLFSRKSAVRSNRKVHVEFNLDDEKYRAYRMDRSQDKPKEDVIVKSRSLSSSNGIMAIASADGKRITEGTITLNISPLGTGEETAIYLGNGTEIKATVIFHKFDEGVDVFYREEVMNLEVPEWRADLENF